MSTLAVSSDRTDRSTAARTGDRAVGVWLLSVAGMIFAMAVIGAITRLTESGLSIMEWAPISGTLPPLTQAEWERLFALYKTIPEYQQINRGMSLAEFKEIFWWEWIHRLWGRLIGALFAGGFLILLLRGKIRRALTPHLIAMFALGGLQGLVGWYMVASGFAERTDVSQYRLAAHLGLALLIYAYVLWVAFTLLAPAPAVSSGARGLRLGLRAFAGLLAVTILAGALVAGINAGLTYNTFPKMAGQWVPSGYWIREPTWLNPFENPAAVQFNHRVLAILTVVAALGLWLWARARPLALTARRALGLLALAATAQLGLGIWTLLWVVPVWLGAAHQAGALTLLGLTVWALTRLNPAAETRTPTQG
ncbi:heme A synthase [Rhodovibrio sodomensis]|uniref:Heme A synthase n=1 Tax=Rhodovibrio sodomensis TaxID=1088 RepID=A0ABS1DEH2_9PROT|nr:COX15/CtaA family protein [Rhodovibrio sodomensis]MBK1668830.1 heme A synthase [Rhodovibrio sodomensis]